MATFTLSINGQDRTVEATPEMPLLWALRDLLGLTGTKYGCGIGSCGACTVHLDGKAARACQTPLSAAQRRAITTIEGLSAATSCTPSSAPGSPRMSQCGYCQPGQLMAAAALLATMPQPTDDDIDAAMLGNLCRCGTYARIRRAIRRAAEGE